MELFSIRIQRTFQLVSTFPDGQRGGGTVESQPSHLAEDA